MGTPLLDHELPYFQQHVPQRSSSAAMDALLRAACDARRTAVAGELFLYVRRGADPAALVQADTSPAGRVREGAQKRKRDARVARSRTLHVSRSAANGADEGRCRSDAGARAGS